MGNHRTARPSVAVAVALLVTSALAGCSATDGAVPAPSASRTASAAAAAADPEQATAAPVDMDPDVTAGATCGQVSAFETLALNAHDGLDRGTLTQAQFDALSASVRFGFEHLASSDAEVSRAVQSAQRYLDQHPAPASGPAFDDTTADWDLRVRTITTACRESGSNVVVSAQYGG